MSETKQSTWKDFKAKIIGKVPDDKRMREFDQFLEVEVMLKQGGVPSHPVISLERCPKGTSKGKTEFFFNMPPASLLQMIDYLVKAYRELNPNLEEENIKWLILQQLGWSRDE